MTNPQTRQRPAATGRLVESANHGSSLHRQYSDFAGGPTITSREIAELVEARHDSVKRTIERLAERGVVAFPPTVEKPTDGRPVLEYVFAGELGKRDSIVVVAQLSPEFTARLVDRWQELEAAAVDPHTLLNDPATMRRLLLGYTEKVLSLEDKLAEQAPKIEAMGRLESSEGSLCITDAAKVLKLRPRTLFQWLNGNVWIYRRTGSTGWHAYQHRIQTGLLEHRTTTVRLIGLDDYGRPRERVSDQVRITPKGLTKLAEVLAAEGVTSG